MATVSILATSTPAQSGTVTFASYAPYSSTMPLTSSSEHGMRVISRVTLTGLLLAVLSVASAQEGMQQPAQKAVLITGASTGIGRLTTERLAAAGYIVYAGARKADDIAALNRIENVVALRLDVTVQQDIDAAVEAVIAGGHGLYGIVNNAGVNVLGPLIEIKESDIDFLFDVNVYGPYRITKAFAPMVIEQHGRIVNISSISGTLSSGLYGAYAMSKHALEAYTDSLAEEMSLLGVKVIGIEPGNFRTNLWHNRCDRMLASGYDPKGSHWEQHISRVVAICKERPEDTDPEPHIVAEAIQHALFSDQPKQHYLVVPERSQAEVTIYKAIEELLALNEDQPFSYSRDELVHMLDNELDAMSKGTSMVPGPPRN
jgi:NAD(P)-dependent dehydrogenase (short-subunit alcohol dehydrogenase family)